MPTMMPWTGVANTHSGRILITFRNHEYTRVLLGIHVQAVAFC